MRATGAALVGALLLSQGATHGAVTLPPICASSTPGPEAAMPIAELRKEVEAKAESDPELSVRLMCAAIPRVAREYGEDSLELAWWLGSLAMPLIAYMDKHAEAEPLLANAERIFTKQLGADAEELADIYVAHAWIQFRQGRLRECESAWKQALAIRELKPGPRSIELQKALVGLAQVQVSLRDFAVARATLERAKEILKRNGDEVSEAAAAIENTLTNIGLREENYLDARGHAEAQIEIETRMNSAASQLVPAYALLGQVLERLDEFEASETAIREAVRLSESAEGPLQRHRLAALTRLANLLHDRGRPLEALDAAELALREAERTLAPDAPKLVGVLRIVAETERSVGDLPKALHAYERAATIVERHPGDIERQTLVAFYRGLGELWLALGDVAQARAALTAGLESAGQDKTLATERAGVLQAMATSEAESNAEQSRKWLSEALWLLRTRLPDAHPSVLRVIDDLCAIEIGANPFATPDCEDAAARLASAREVEPSLRSAIYANQSRLAEARGNSAGAYASAVKALAAASALGTPDPLFRAQFQLARLLEARGNHALAILFGKLALTEVARLRERFVGEDRRFDRGFLENKAAVYRAVADWLMEAGRLDEGLAVLRSLKTEELHDFAQRGAGLGPGRENVELTVAEQSLWARYALAVDVDPAAGAELARLGNLSEAGKISVKERERLDAALTGQRTAETERAARIGAFIAEAEQAGRSARQRPKPQANTLTQDVRRLGRNTALALYLMTDDHLRIVIATERGQVQTEIPISARALRGQIGDLLDRIGGREDVSEAARALYETIAKPVDQAAERAGAARLVLELDGALRYVPFAALSDGRKTLIEKYAIELRAPAGAAPPSGIHVAPGLKVRGLGVTRAVPGFRALPAVADELRSVVRGPIAGLTSDAPGEGALPGEGFADAAFTESRFRLLLSDPRDFSVLHLGTHFNLRPGNSLRSFLVLGDGSRLTLDQLDGLDFSGIELFTLSACETGLGGAVTDDGREIEGLSAIVRRRGAKHVVASLWSVEDASTAKLMGRFYNGIGATGADAARALQQAQLGLRGFEKDGVRPYQHPYYWAGFVLSGTTEP